MWGNDPNLKQKAFEEGGIAKESWMNKEFSDRLWAKMAFEKGKRINWGWNGRLNGPGM
jgi:hypothetical protein